MSTPRDLGNLTIENARILFRNFRGEEGPYNAKGVRNFVLVLDNADGEQMKADGWNVKYLKPLEDGDSPQAYVSVTARFDNRPPRVVMITSKGRTTLDEEAVEILDWVDIATVDLIVTPSSWTVNGNSGVKAYLKSIFITIAEDELELKYADVREIGSNDVPTLALTDGNDEGDEIVLDAEDDDQ